MKYVIPVIAMLLAPGTAAQAKLTPFDGTQERSAPAVASAGTAAAPATAERMLFRAPASEKPTKPGRCTATTFVFTKIRLAQACY